MPVHYKDSRSMTEVRSGSVHLIITSPPYLATKDYSLDGRGARHSATNPARLGDITDLDDYLDGLRAVWRECSRVLAPNGKLVVNAPLMPVPKSVRNTHHNRHIHDLNAEIQRSILDGTNLYLMDTYIWNRTNPSKGLMFGSYPYPNNLYAQNTIEFVTVYTDGRPPRPRPRNIRERSRLTKQEWVEFTRQIWHIPVPNKGDSAFGIHPAIMPEEIPYRCIRMFTFIGDTVLDPFAGSGTTLKVAQMLGRNHIGYELMEAYRPCIERKLAEAGSGDGPMPRGPTTDMHLPTRG